MSRPGKQTVDYFPHYAGASNGKTMYILQNKYGNDGYAFWFKLLEMLASAEGHYLSYKDPADWQFLLAKTRVTDNRAKEILATLADVKAIEPELYQHQIIWIQKFIDNLEAVYKRRTMANPRKPRISDDGKVIDDNIKAIPEDKKLQSKVDETKLDESISNESEGSSSDSNKNLTKDDAIEAYEKNIGEVSETMENEIEIAVKRFGATWVIDAMREAAIRNKKQWPYIAGILKNWEKYGQELDITPAGKSVKDNYESWKKPNEKGD